MPSEAAPGRFFFWSKPHTESRLLLLGALALAIPHASAQTRVTGTIADMDGFMWAN